MPASVLALLMNSKEIISQVTGVKPREIDLILAEIKADESV